MVPSKRKVLSLLWKMPQPSGKSIPATLRLGSLDTNRKVLATFFMRFATPSLCLGNAHGGLGVDVALDLGHVHVALQIHWIRGSNT